MTGPGPVHFCHLSNAAAVRAAKTVGTIEATPHHLFLSRERFSPDDARGKVNPPLRSEHERKALWEVWDLIDVIASDHAPHTVREKDAGFIKAPSGIPGVETMIPLLLGAVLERRISLASVIEKTSAAPSRILGIPEAGFSVGNRADFAIFPREAVPISADLLHSRCGWSPFEGMPAVFPREVIISGMTAFREGEFFPVPARWYPGRGFMGKTEKTDTADTAYS
jgi:dihydroorotase